MEGDLRYYELNNEIMGTVINEIIGMPHSINKVHASCYRSYMILGYIMEMIERGDSKETIKEIHDFMMYYE